MRREGSELAVGKPRVIIKEIGGHKHEPFEHLVVEVPTAHQSAVIRLVLERQGDYHKVEHHGGGMNLEFHIPARGLIGLRTRMLTATQGTAIMHHNFLDYRPLKGTMTGRALGVMVSTETGKATAYAIEGLQDRGSLFVSPMEQVYEGQVVGEHCRDNDLPVNICREKKLTNIRSATAEIKTVIKQPRDFSLEMALEYIEEDELVEITPKAVRMRKIYLKESDRKKQARQQV
jgi:GTP-binding protein